jgi:2-methylcitrate dehydratase PrpD
MSSTIDFIHDTTFDVLPPLIVSEAIRCLTDTLGVAAGGSRTQLSRIIRNHAARQFAGGRRQSGGMGAWQVRQGLPLPTP